MVLFVSDLHLGRSGADERPLVQAFVHWLDAHADADALFIVGDLFDAWIEHRHLVPRLPVRLLGALAAWTDAGKQLAVFAGNHDPWHRSFLHDELGAAVHFDGLHTAQEGRRLYLHHGDGVAPHGLYRHLRPVLRHPLPVGLYRLLPADAGMGLARRVSARMRRRHHEGAARAMRAHARTLLAHGEAEAVVFGHTHVPELNAWPEGVYANPGAWYETQTFLRLDADGWTLARWADGRAEEVAQERA